MHRKISRSINAEKEVYNNHKGGPMIQFFKVGDKNIFKIFIRLSQIKIFKTLYKIFKNWKFLIKIINKYQKLTRILSR